MAYLRKHGTGGNGMNRARKQAERVGYTKEAEYRREYITLVVVYLVMMIAICIGGCYAN